MPPKIGRPSSMPLPFADSTKKGSIGEPGVAVSCSSTIQRSLLFQELLLGDQEGDSGKIDCQVAIQFCFKR